MANLSDIWGIGGGTGATTANTGTTSGASSGSGWTMTDAEWNALNTEIANSRSGSNIASSGGSSTLGGTTQSGSGAYGTVPTVASPQTTQTSALTGDIANLGNISSLTSGLDTASAAGLNSALQTSIPGYSALSQTASNNIQNDLSGVIGSDVMTLLNTQAAERGVSFDPNSANTNAAALRAMGLTSMGLQSQGQTELANRIASTKTTQFNPASMLVTPGEQQAAQTSANIYASSPNPSAAAAANQSAASSGYHTGAASGGGGGAH